MTDEVFVSGYCRTINANRMICCEYAETEEGVLLDGTDCDFGNCRYENECQLIRQAREKEQVR